MPHPRSRANPPPHDDSRSEAGDTRDKPSGNPGNANSDRRRQTAVAVPNTSDKNPLTSGATNSNGTHAHEGIEGVIVSPFRHPNPSLISTDDASRRWAGMTSTYGRCTATDTHTDFRCRLLPPDSITQFSQRASARSLLVGLSRGPVAKCLQRR